MDTKTIGIRLDTETIELIDEAARLLKNTRSGAIRYLVSVGLDQLAISDTQDGG
jgi:hypothetical protein